MLEASNKENKITFQALSKWDKKECQDVCEVSTPKTLSSLKHVDQSTTCERSATPAIGLKDIYRLDGRNNTPITF